MSFSQPSSSASPRAGSTAFPRFSERDAAEVSRAASSILDVDDLIQTSVNLIRDQFNFYYVGLFLYAGNRLHDSIAIFSIGAADMLTYRGEELKVRLLGGPSRTWGPHSPRVAQLGLQLVSRLYGRWMAASACWYCDSTWAISTCETTPPL